MRWNTCISDIMCWDSITKRSRRKKASPYTQCCRALRFQASLPLEFWGQCILAAGYLINRTPATTLGGKTPFELLYKWPPPLNHLRVFGCLCYVHNQNTKGDKFASRSKPSIFLGYPFGKKGWRVFDLETKKISVSRDVIFLEDQFPFATPSTLSSSSILSPLLWSTFGPSDIYADDFDLIETEHDYVPNQVVDIAHKPTSPHTPARVPTPEIPTSPPRSSSPVTQTLASATPHTPSPMADTITQQPLEELGHGLRPKSQPVYLSDYVLATKRAQVLPFHPV